MSRLFNCLLKKEGQESIGSSLTRLTMKPRPQPAVAEHYSMIGQDEVGKVIKPGVVSRRLITLPVMRMCGIMLTHARYDRPQAGTCRLNVRGPVRAAI